MRHLTRADPYRWPRTKGAVCDGDPGYAVSAVAKVSMSISNAAAALRCYLGVDPHSQVFHRPLPMSIFDDAWTNEPSVRRTNIDSIVHIDRKDEASRAELRAILEQRGQAARSGETS